MPLCVKNVFSCHVLPCVCSTIYVHTSSVDVGQCDDDVQLQFVDCALVEGLVDLFGVKTCTWTVFDETMYDTFFEA
jgi:hypothetical protein